LTKCPISLPSLVDACVVLVGFIEVEIQNLREVETNDLALARGIEGSNVVPFEAMVLRRTVKTQGPARLARIAWLERQLDDARTAQLCLAGIDLGQEPKRRPTDPRPPSAA
jgi:hypothetical protein